MKISTFLPQIIAAVRTGEVKNLDEALFLGMKWIIRDKIDNDKFLHPDSIKMFNSMLG